MLARRSDWPPNPGIQGLREMSDLDLVDLILVWSLSWGPAAEDRYGLVQNRVWRLQLASSDQQSLRW